MADTGRTVFADGLWADNLWAVGLWAADEAQAVPDVVGQLQAAGTSTLQGAGFVVAVVTAYSSTVPAGTIISQSPIGGSLAAPGSTVTITVSLGDAPVSPEGGGGPDRSDSPEYWYWLQKAREELKRQAATRQAIRESVESIPDATDREIATLLKKQEAKDESKKELTKLQQFADTAARKLHMAPSPKLRELVRDAALLRTNTSLLTLQREMAKMDEEEEALVVTLLLMQ